MVKVVVRPLGHVLERQDVVMRFEYPAGERMFVDFCGDTLPITDPDTGEVWEAQVFVSALAASGYMFVEATGSQDLTARRLRVQVSHWRPARSRRSARSTPACHRRFWINRGHLTEAGYQFSRLLPHAVDDSPASSLVTFAAAIVDANQDRFGEARTGWEQVIERAARVGDWGLQAGALAQLARYVLNHEGDAENARRLALSSLQIRTEHGDQWGIAASLGVLARVAVAEGDGATALHLLDEAVVHGRAAGDTTGVAENLRVAANCHLLQGSLESALAYLRESMMLFRDVLNPDRLSMVVAGFGWLTLADGQVERGFRLLAAARGQIAMIRYTAPWRDPINQYPTIAASARQAVGDAVADAALADGRMFTLETAIQYALDTGIQSDAETPAPLSPSQHWHNAAY